MNKTLYSQERGFSTLAIVITVAVVALGAYGAYYWTSSRVDGDAMMEDDSMHMEDNMGDGMMKTTSPTSDAMMKDDAMKKDGAMMDGAMMDLKFSGTVLAGTKSPLLDFNKADYDKAVASGKLVALFFYANWCPICKEEFPKMEQAFNAISDDKVVGFRVNFNDNQTDDSEKELARQFGVAYQHTKVFIKGGERVLKAPESWSSAQVYTSKINEYK